jgi:hypothetical protein
MVPSPWLKVSGRSLANARFVPTETPNGFVICSRAKPPIVDGRQQSLSVSDNEEAPAAEMAR